MRPLLRLIECGCVAVAVVLVLGGVVVNGALEGVEMARRWADG